jgi:Peptidase family M28/PA domain
MKNLLRFSCLIMVFFHVDHFYGQAASDAIRFAEGITPSEMKEHLTVLASDDYEGRETGQKGQKKAAQYLVDYYKSLGIQPCVNGSYLQSFPLKKESFVGSYVKIADVKKNFIEDFYFWGPEWQNLDFNDLVFVGYGIDDKKYSDYEHADVQGKVVMCLLGEPIDAKGNSIITGTNVLSDWSNDYKLKRDVAVSKGATALVFVNPNFTQYLQRVKYWLETPAMRLDNPKRPKEDEFVIPTIFVSPDLANDILKSGKKKLDIRKIQKSINKLGKTKVFSLKVKPVSFHVELQQEFLTAENVLCFIEGSDPELRNQVVVISAHYDHIGIQQGEINNGADDDGSGTVSAMEIAEAFTEARLAGFGPKRSVLILNVSGEEKGLLGSEWYSDFPVFPLENTVCDLNIDMIGRMDKEHTDGNYVYIIGSDKLSTDLHRISEANNSGFTKLALDYTYNDPKDPNRFYYRSDHYNFAKHNIPVIFYFSGVHEDYHKPGDDTEKIMFDKMAVIVRLVFYTAWEVANRTEKLKVDVVSPFEERE